MAELEEGVTRLVLEEQPDDREEIHEKLTRLISLGNLNEIQKIFEKYGSSIDVNKKTVFHVGNLIDPMRRAFDWSMQDCATFLGAACLSNESKVSLDIVQFLVSKGADIHSPATMLGPPLCTAAYGGNIDIVKYLIQLGASVCETSSCNSNFPLVSALLGLRDNLKIAQYLIDNGANVCQETFRGYTALHVVSFELDNLDAVKLLLSNGAPPMFATARLMTNTQNQVPCPLYLAAVKTHHSIVEYFIDMPECPPICRAEAYLIMGSCVIEEINKSALLKGLEYMNVLETKPIYPPTLQEYGHRKEMTTLDEYNAIKDDINELMLQSLLIMERCCGVAYSRTSINLVITLRHAFKNDDLLPFFNGILKRLTLSVVKIFETLRGRPNVLFLKFLESQSSFVKKLDTRVWSDLFNSQFDLSHIDLSVMADFFFTILNGLVGIKNTCNLKGIEKDLRSCFNSIVRSLLLTLLIWYDDSKKEENEIKRVHEAGNLAVDIREYFQRLLNEYLHSPIDGSSLLMIALEQSRYMNFTLERGCAFLKQILDWGLDEVINEQCLSEHGMRPLHKVINKYGDESSTVVCTLLVHGAHYDAVDDKGQTAVDYCTNAGLISSYLITYLQKNGPLPLSCQAARVIVLEKLPYYILPKHIIQFVKLHDSSK